MFYAGSLNVGSLLLGVVALFLPVYGLCRRSITGRGSVLLSAISLGCCCVSILFQVLYANHLALIDDWAAMLDTSDMMVKISLLMLVVVLLLNVGLFIKSLVWKPRPLRKLQ